MTTLLRMSSPALRVVVLGGSGFVGTHLVTRIANRGDAVVVPTRRAIDARHLLTLPTVELVETDVHQPDRLTALLAGADAVINLVGILHERRRGDFQRVHAGLAQTLVASCRAAGVRRLVQMSALSAATNAPSEYLRSKGAAEAVIAGSGLDWTIFRPSVIFGPADSFLNLFARLQRLLPVVLLAKPESRLQPVYVCDVVTAFATCITLPETFGQRYDLVGPRRYTLRDLVRYAGETAGTPRPIVALPDGLAALQAAVLEHLPGKLMTRDNLASLSVDNVSDQPFPEFAGVTPTALESIAPGYLAPGRDPYDEPRRLAGR